jgi:hypothetical protein
VLTVGLDGLKRSGAPCVPDRQGKQVPAKSLPGGWRALREILKSLNNPFQIYCTASCD